ncbi:unnamed protein product, partial [Didymodactylos carnosus]
NSGLQLRRTETSPVHMGPSLIHYGNKSECYEHLINYIKENGQYPLIIRSDTASKIKKAVSKVFPPTTHLFCTRHSQTFQEHLINGIRNAPGYVNQDGTAKLFNNDNEAINHMLKNESDWKQRLLSDVLDLIDRSLTAQKKETIRSSYGGGESQLIDPFCSVRAMYKLKRIDIRRRKRVGLTKANGSDGGLWLWVGKPNSDE